MEFRFLGKTLIVLGAFLILAGTLFWLSPKLTLWFGRLPGDIAVRKKGVTFYFPLATCLICSLILSLVFWLFGKK
ncbi:MAG TPA: DUF2905 domain-containing protein [bacterium]|nr:DUF2905 domain-containing protein [bacterium]